MLQSQVKVRAVTLWLELEIEEVDIFMLIGLLTTYLDHNEAPILTMLIIILTVHHEGEEKLHHSPKFRHKK